MRTGCCCCCCDSAKTAITAKPFSYSFRRKTRSLALNFPSIRVQLDTHRHTHSTRRGNLNCSLNPFGYAAFIINLKKKKWSHNMTKTNVHRCNRSASNWCKATEGNETKQISLQWWSKKKKQRKKAQNERNPEITNEISSYTRARNISLSLIESSFLFLFLFLFIS